MRRFFVAFFLGLAATLAAAPRFVMRDFVPARGVKQGKWYSPITDVARVSGSEYLISGDPND